METERGHMSLRRGVSWSPGGVRKPLQVGQESVDLVTESNASWDRRDYTKVKGQSDLASSTNQTARKANLTRSTSLSDQDLKEARVRSQIIAAQLTVPSNSNSRGVQLFNRRRQRVNAFTLKSGVEGGSGRGTAEDEKHIGPPRNNLRWAERASEGNDREQNLKNIASKPPWSPTRLTFRGHHSSDIMEEPSEPVDKVEDVKDTQERHFLPVNEKEEEEEVKMREEEEVKMREEEEVKMREEEEEVKMREEEEQVKMKEEAEEVKMREEEKEVKMREEEEEVKEEQRIEAAVEQESEVKNVIPSATDHSDAVQSEPELGEAGVNGPITEPEPPGDLPNGCHDAPEKVSVSLSKQPSTIINRTARPFFSPTTVQSPDTQSPVMDIPPAPSYSTPPLPLPRPVAFSPPPPPPSYPTPPLPALTCQSPPVFSSPLCRSPAMSPLPPPVCQNAPPSAPPMSCYVSPTPPVTQYAPLTAPRPSTFVPKPATDWKQPMQIKTGILEETAARRANRKSMFTFKEKPVMAPNPELLSLVQGADERKKHGPRSVAEPASEEELLALGAEASNFLAKEEVKMEEATVPEWSTTLKSSRTRARIEHKPEQTLTNVTGKGAELFAKRQSRMEKYVLENQNAGQRRSPSPTMSLPPSWVYPSNMPGRVKAIASNSNISNQLSRTLKAQQPVQRKPIVKAPPPKPESPPLENGCTKIERDLSRHQPYQLNSSLFIFNPIKDPISSLPRGAPPPKPVVTSYSRQTSLPTSPSSQFSPQASFRPATCLSPQHPLSPVGGMAPGDQSHQYGGAPRARQPRITSPVSAFSPERVASPRSGAQAPRPTFSAKKAGIEPQAIKESPTTPTQTPTPTRTPQFTRRFSSPEGPRSGTWSPSLQTSQLPSNTPSRSPHTPISSAPVYPPWETRCQSPMVYQTSQPFSTPISRPQHPPTTTSPVTLVRENRCLSPNVSSLDSKANHRILAKNIINAAKRKNSPSPGTLSSHNLPISPLGGPHNQAYEHSKPPFSPFQSRALGAQSPPFTSPPPTPTQLIRSPVRLYNTRSLTDSDASVESEDSGLRSPGLRSYNTCPRGWGGSLRVKRSSISTDL